MLFIEAGINFQNKTTETKNINRSYAALFDKCLFFEEIYASLQRILVP